MASRKDTFPELREKPTKVTAEANKIVGDTLTTDQKSGFAGAEYFHTSHPPFTGTA